MRGSKLFWNIRFASTVRQLFSRIPRGEASAFDEAVQLLRAGPLNLPNVEQVGEKPVSVQSQSVSDRI
jgi:hypothetical protein